MLTPPQFFLSTHVLSNPHIYIFRFAAHDSHHQGGTATYEHQAVALIVIFSIQCCLRGQRNAHSTTSNVLPQRIDFALGDPASRLGLVLTLLVGYEHVTARMLGAGQGGLRRGYRWSLGYWKYVSAAPSIGFPYLAFGLCRRLRASVMI